MALFVLLVDDSDDDVLLTRRAFKKAALEVELTTCSDGEQALAFFDNDESDPIPRLVLLDWKLPRLTGLEVLNLLRARRKTCSLPVIIISASGLQEDAAQARFAGANAYLQKPLDATMLRDVLKSLGML